jgi:hypothetical protein
MWTIHSALVGAPASP